MASLTELRDGLEARLATITGLRTHSNVPSKIEIPAAVVGPSPNEPLAVYGLTFGGGTTYRFLVRLFVDRVTEGRAQEKLDAYISEIGAQSVPAAIEGDRTLGGKADTTRVIQARNFGTVRVADIDYLVVDFDVEVVDSL